jgi:cytochrome oxidase Cu insertion factor (SCO1/SenC/PrrC family)
LPRKKAKRRRSTAEIIGFIAIGLFVVALVWLFISTPTQNPAQTTHTLATDFVLTDVDGNTFKLSDQQGKVVVLEFMRTTCPACISEEPYLRQLRSNFGSDVVMVIVSIDPTTDTDSVLRDHRDQNLMGWLAMGDKTEVFKLFGVQATPTIFIIDKNGYIQYKHVGVTESSVLISEADSLRK